MGECYRKECSGYPDDCIGERGGICNRLEIFFLKDSCERIRIPLIDKLEGYDGAVGFTERRKHERPRLANMRTYEIGRSSVYPTTFEGKSLYEYNDNYYTPAHIVRESDVVTAIKGPIEPVIRLARMLSGECCYLEALNRGELGEEELRERRKQALGELIISDKEREEIMRRIYLRK